MLGDMIVKLTDTDNEVCYINLYKVNMILVDSVSEEASIYLDYDRAIVVKIDDKFEKIDDLLSLVRLEY